MRELIEKIAYMAIRLCKGNVYFFDNEGIYRKVSIDDAKKMNLKCFYVREDGSVYLILSDFVYYMTKVSNQNLIKMALCQLNPGDNIEKFEYYLQTVQMNIREKPKGLDRFITKIKSPIFIRKPENPKVNTFDYIYIDLNIVSEWEEERKKYIKKHLKEIYEKVINELEKDKDFQKYGVPISFLKISRITLTKSNVLEFVLEIKEV